MYITKTRMILIAVFVAILTFFLAVVPVTADTFYNEMADSCNCDCNCNCNTLYIQSSTPVCCSMLDGSFADCSLNDMPDNEAMLPGRTTINLDVHNGQYIQCVSTETDNDPNQFLQQESSQSLPAHLCSEYHCRNSLNSEDPLGS